MGLKKDSPGPIMVSNTLCPAVYILGTKNVHSRAKITADHYWPWAAFFLLFSVFRCILASLYEVVSIHRMGVMDSLRITLEIPKVVHVP